MAAYYNEIDPFAAAWLRELIKHGHIADGIVDERSIEDVVPSELTEFTQCHFFAGIGVWSYALRQSGWPDDRPVWTGSCPCQSFSSAGKKKGTEDSRHLWPVWYNLIKVCKPEIIFGEQVASSLIMGKATNESLQSLQKKFAGNGLFETYERAIKIDLQSMSSSDCKREILKIRQARGYAEVPSIPGNPLDLTPGKLLNNCCETTGKNEEFDFRFGPLQGRNTGNNQQRGMPSNRYTIRYECKTEVEQSIIRPDKPYRRIRSPECSSGSILTECNDARLGVGLCSGSNDCTQQKGELINDRTESEPTGKDCTGTDEKSEWSWIDLVFDDLESSGYSCAAVAFPSASVGAPHIRDRAYWVADADNRGKLPLLRAEQNDSTQALRRSEADKLGRCLAGGDKSELIGMANAGLPQREPQQDFGASSIFRAAIQQEERRDVPSNMGAALNSTSEPGPTNGFWRNADWLFCRDGKWRPVEPGSKPLAYWTTKRVGRLRGYGNAIVAPQAKAFIEAVMETI